MSSQKKVDTYLASNPVVKKFVNELDTAIEAYWNKNFVHLTPTKVRLDIGSKYIRIWHDTNCWGFISRVDGQLKGESIKKGDLLMPAGWKTPTKGARGNIVDGTAQWDVYGPLYKFQIGH